MSVNVIAGQIKLDDWQALLDLVLKSVTNIKLSFAGYEQKDANQPGHPAYPAKEVMQRTESSCRVDGKVVSCQLLLDDPVAAWLVDKLQNSLPGQGESLWEYDFLNNNDKPLLSVRDRTDIFVDNSVKLPAGLEPNIVDRLPKAPGPTIWAVS